jgi:type I restriction enzyme S subunit
VGGLMSRLVPKLRFKEFSGEWNKKPINKILTIGSGKDYKHLSSGDIPVYGTGGYMLSVNDYLYDRESVCIGRKGTIDKPMLLTGKFWTVDTLFYTHSFKNNIPKFIYALFLKINWYKYNEASGVPSLSKVTIGKIDIFIPPPKEQQKIASCLSSLDALIEAQNKKVSALKQHKKGLMQQLFPKSGETTPTLRFKAFSGEWEEKIISDLANRYDNLRIPIAASNRIEGVTPYYGANGIQSYIQGYTHDGIKPFLCCLSTDTFLFCASIRASRDERQEAIFCCSFGIGKTRGYFLTSNISPLGIFTPFAPFIT